VCMAASDWGRGCKKLGESLHVCVCVCVCVCVRERERARACACIFRASSVYFSFSVSVFVRRLFLRYVCIHPPTHTHSHIYTLYAYIRIYILAQIHLHLCVPTVNLLSLEFITLCMSYMGATHNTYIKFSTIGHIWGPLYDTYAVLHYMTYL